jgi:hypothetical protein
VLPVLGGEIVGARKGGDGIGLKIVAKLAAALEVEPAELLRVPAAPKS